MQTFMPLFCIFKVMDFEKTTGPEQRYTTDWHARVPDERALQVT
jgi:hypothetical protein